MRWRPALASSLPRTTRPTTVITMLLGAALTTALVGTALSGTSQASPPEVRAEPAGPPGSKDAGRWQVEPLSGDRYVVRWTSPKSLPMTSDRPTIRGAGLSFGPATVRDDGRTIEAVVVSASVPDPAMLDVALSGDHLEESRPARSFRAPLDDPTLKGLPSTHPLLAPDPGVAGPHATSTSDYELPRLKVPGLLEPIEMVGHVVEPVADADTGNRPLVLFIPGRHAVCYDPDDPEAASTRWPCTGRFDEVPTHLGHHYLQQVLASQGHTTVSVGVNGVNAQDDALGDGGADARARVVLRHLDHWVGLARDRQVDLDQVILVGHSRGGEGASRAATRIPLSAPYRVAGQVLLAPTNFATNTAPYVPTVTVLPSCDGDVADLQGQRYTDTSRDVMTDDTSLKSSVLVMGANHNFFNTEWTPGVSAAPSVDDWGGPADQPCGRRTPERLTAPEQRAVGTVYVAGAVGLFTGQVEYLPLFDGSAATTPSVGDADVRSHAMGGGRDVRRPGIEATPTTSSGGARARLCTGRVGSGQVRIEDCLQRARAVTPHWVGYGDLTPRRMFWEMTWSRSGAVAGLRFDQPLDLDSARLEMRTIVAPGIAAEVRVRITDGAGDSDTLLPVGGSSLPPLMASGSATKMWAQSVLVDASAARGVDLSDIRSVELVGGAGGGRLWVADLAAAPLTLASVPAIRAPQVHLGELTIAEGDPSGDRPTMRTARVPFAITGTVTRPGRLLVVTDGLQPGSKQRFTVEIAPGQTTGSIPVRYRVDRLDSGPAGASYMAVWPLRGLATDDYLGNLVVRDDDPTPAVRLHLTRRVQEGQPIVMTARLVEPVGYHWRVTLAFVGGHVPRALRGTDLRRPWLRRQGITGDLDRPLSRLGVSLTGSAPGDRRTIRIEIPTRRDRAAEPPERVTVAYSDSIGGRPPRTRTVVVRDRR